MNGGFLVDLLAATGTSDQHSSSSQGLESSSTEQPSSQPQSVSLVPVTSISSTSRNTSSSTPGLGSSPFTTEETDSSSTSHQFYGSTNMETTKTSEVEYEGTETTDSSLNAYSANHGGANTAQLQYNASTLPGSQNRTVFFKSSPSVVVVLKPLVFDYPFVKRITFLSNDTDEN